MHPLLEGLFKEIEHGDEEHRKWLYDKLEDFSKRYFKVYHCQKHEWEVYMSWGGYDKLYNCKHCGFVTDDPCD